MGTFDLVEYVDNHMGKLVKEILLSSFTNPRESAFFMKYSLAAKKAASLRKTAEEEGVKIPEFITARLDERDTEHGSRLSSGEWRRIFLQAEEAGVAVIALAGGDPLSRPDVLAEAAQIQSLIFPVFTSCAAADKAFFELTEKNRNIIPVIGAAADTNEDVLETVKEAASSFNRRGVLFAAFAAVTGENLPMAVNRKFAGTLDDMGCKALVFIERAVLDKNYPALNGDERSSLAAGIAHLRMKEKMMIICFSEEEAAAAELIEPGQGFFIVGADGRVWNSVRTSPREINLKEKPLSAALRVVMR